MSVLGGIGYILSLIPIANLVAPLLIGIAWFRAGSRTGQTVFRATGLLMIINFLLTVGLVAVLFGSLLPLLFMLPLTGGLDFLSPESLEQMLGPNLLGIFGIVAVSGLVLAVLGFVTFVLEIVSHFRAATVLNSRWFRRAAWMRITLVVVLIVIVVALIGLAFLLPLPGGFGPVEQLTSGLILLFLPVIVVGLLASIFSAIAFFTAEYP